KDGNRHILPLPPAAEESGEPGRDLVPRRRRRVGHGGFSWNWDGRRDATSNVGRPRPIFSAEMRLSSRVSAIPGTAGPLWGGKGSQGRGLTALKWICR